MTDTLIEDIKSDSELKKLKAKHVREKNQLESKHESEMKEMYSRQEAEMKEIELKLLLFRYRELEKRVHNVKQESVIIDTSDEDVSDDEENNTETNRMEEPDDPTNIEKSKAKPASVTIEEVIVSNRARSRPSKSTNGSIAKKARTNTNVGNTNSSIKPEPENLRLRRSRRLSRLDPLVFPVEHLRDNGSENESNELIKYEQYQSLSKSAKLRNKRVRLPRNIFEFEDYSHFVQKWFYGNRDPFVIPLSDLKKRVSDWKIIADFAKYNMYEKLGILIEKAFPDIRTNRTFVNSIDHYMKNHTCEDPYLTNEIKTPESLSYFLNGGDKIPDQYKKLLMKGRHQMIVDILTKQN